MSKPWGSRRPSFLARVLIGVATRRQLTRQTGTGRAVYSLLRRLEPFDVEHEGVRMRLYAEDIERLIRR